MSSVERGKRLKIYERDGWRCVYCGCEVEEHEAVWESLKIRYPLKGGKSYQIQMSLTKERRDRIAVLDHVVPKSKGGSSRYDNLVTACWLCNSRKGSKPASLLIAKIQGEAATRGRALAS